MIDLAALYRDAGTQVRRKTAPPSGSMPAGASETDITSQGSHSSCGPQGPARSYSDAEALYGNAEDVIDGCLLTCTKLIGQFPRGAMSETYLHHFELEAREGRWTERLTC